MPKLEELRKVQLELLEQFIKVCEREDIKWYATHGTLLGAMREGGYLIWDDDIDVAMPAEDYDRLMQNKQWFCAPYFLQTPLDAGRFCKMKLCKDGTTAFCEPLHDILRKGGHRGICIDILPLDEIGNSGYYFLGGKTVRKDYFEPAAKAKFEYLNIVVPSKARKVLGMIYGYWNWPGGAQYAQVHHWFYDTNKDYLDYVQRYTGWPKAAENKKIYLFGAADSLRIWLKDFGLRQQVVCCFDNDESKWQSEAFGVPVENPAKIAQINWEDSVMIVVSIWHREIGEQLEKMGIDDYYVFLDGLFENEFTGNAGG